MGIIDRIKGAGRDLTGAAWGKIEQYNDYLDLGLVIWKTL